jgi:uncharacterized membrane protein (UPF0127 family)
MAGDPRKGYAFNRTRQAFLATELLIADSHWSRLRGLMATNPSTFRFGQGLWIVPSHGVHTLAMRYPIDVIYLNDAKTVIHLEENVKPWRFAPVRMEAATVIELPCHTVWNTGTTLGDQIEIAFNVNHKRTEAV